MTPSRHLTKTLFSVALECPTKLYYTKNSLYTDQKGNDEFLNALAAGGFQIGSLARHYYPGGHHITSLDIEDSIKKTNELLLKDKVIIYEAAIKFENYFIRVDILIKDGNNIKLIEVKAKSYKSEEAFYSIKGFIKSKWLPYFYDVAFQFWVMENALPDYNITPYLMLANKNEKTSVSGLNQFFKIKKDKKGYTQIIESENIKANKLGNKILSIIDVSTPLQMIYSGVEVPLKSKIGEKSKKFTDRIKEYEKYYKNNIMYPISIGSKCKKCQFKDENKNNSGYYNCWTQIFPLFNLTEPHMFDIWNFKRIQKMLDQGIYRMEDIYSTDLANNLNDRQLLQVEKTITQSSQEYIDTKLFNEMEKWEFPLHFIDFETCMIAIPFHKNKFPYEQLAFQFSCHTLYKDGTVIHDEWIQNDANQFPNYDFVKELKKVLDKDNGTIFCYSSHENTVLLQIKSQMIEEDSSHYKEIIEWIDTITEQKDSDNPRVSIPGDRNMVDLLYCVRQYYYHPKMKGSNSLKYVLPAIFSSSSFIKNKYTSELNFGTHLKGSILWKMNKETNDIHSPYQLLKNKYKKSNLNEDDIFFLNKKIEDGAAAMLAYSKLQFSEMKDEEREILTSALLQYCELDTLAMLMVYEHWNSLT